ncbi:MAG: hypothetical protein WCB57_16495, partial [Pseudonocardiaceae bacterium]
AAQTNPVTNTVQNAAPQVTSMIENQAQDNTAGAPGRRGAEAARQHLPPPALPDVRWRRQPAV